MYTHSLDLIDGYWTVTLDPAYAGYEGCSQPFTSRKAAQDYINALTY